MSEEESAHKPVAEDARIDTLEARLKAAEEREDQRNRPKHGGTDENFRGGHRVLADLIGGMLGGALIGWGFDYLAGTSPWGLLVMLFLGTVVAFRNIIRSANKHSD